VPQIDNAFMLKLSVSAGHRVGIDQQFFSDLADAGELLSGTQNSGFDRMFHLFYELKIQGDAG
jgi:hypothetical protein